MNAKKTIYKILSLGNFSQELPDGETILSRPCIMVDAQRKKWGNEYILFQKRHWDSCSGMFNGKSFIGKFGFDKKKQAKIFMIDVVDEKIIPEYFIMKIDHTEPFNKRYDLVKADPASYSKIFSSAYHKDDPTIKCQSILLLQNGDVVTVDNKRMIFSAKKEELVPA